jgi:predicted DNA-binding protein YlxM (UPF0122 family)
MLGTINEEAKRLEIIELENLYDVAILAISNDGRSLNDLADELVVNKRPYVANIKTYREKALMHYRKALEVFEQSYPQNHKFIGEIAICEIAEKIAKLEYELSPPKYTLSEIEEQLTKLESAVK